MKNILEDIPTFNYQVKKSFLIKQLKIYKKYECYQEWLQEDEVMEKIFLWVKVQHQKMHFVCWETRGHIHTLHQRPPVHSIMSSRLAHGEIGEPLYL